jgi:hypothetical protein
MSNYQVSNRLYSLMKNSISVFEEARRLMIGVISDSKVRIAYIEHL